ASRVLRLATCCVTLRLFMTFRDRFLQSTLQSTLQSILQSTHQQPGRSPAALSTLGQAAGPSVRQLLRGNSFTDSDRVQSLLPGYGNLNLVFLVGRNFSGK